MRLKPRLVSSSRVFEERGDPWVSRRDADTDYPLNRTLYPEAEKEGFHESIQKSNFKRRKDALRLELGLSTADFKPPRLNKLEVNPDLDCFTKAVKAREKHEPGSDKPTVQKESVASLSRMKANLLRKMHSEINRAERTKIEVKPAKIAHNLAVRVKQPKPKFVIYSVRQDGKEEEVERVTLEQAESAVRRKLFDEKVLLIELWSPKGELLKEITKPTAKG